MALMVIVAYISVSEGIAAQFEIVTGHVKGTDDDIVDEEVIDDREDEDVIEESTADEDAVTEDVRNEDATRLPQVVRLLVAVVDAVAYVVDGLGPSSGLDSACSTGSSEEDSAAAEAAEGPATAAAAADAAACNATMSAAAVAAWKTRLVSLASWIRGENIPAIAALSSVSAAWAGSASLGLFEKLVIELLAELIKSVRVGVTDPTNGFEAEVGFDMVKVTPFRVQIPPQ